MQVLRYCSYCTLLYARFKPNRELRGLLSRFVQSAAEGAAVRNQFVLRERSVFVILQQQNSSVTRPRHVYAHPARSSPRLSAAWSGPARKREGDMLRVCSNSAVVHTPAIANLHRQDWCKLCGCNPFKEVCTLCYHGVRTQSSYGQGPETSAKMPVGALQRLHNLGNCFLGSIHNPRRPAGSDVPSEVNLVKLL